MPASKEEKEFTSYIVDLMEPLGSVISRGMFGGFGIFLDGLMFALIAESVLYLKVDKETELDFTEKGLEPFIYQKRGKEFKMSYYQAPEEIMENSEEMERWARKAYNSAVRSSSKKKKEPLL